MNVKNTITYRGHIVTYEQLKPSSKLPLEVECESCHNTFITSKYQITRNGHAFCQPCAIRSKLEKPLKIGSCYGRLTVIGKGAASGHSSCKCDCGTFCDVYNYNLESGHTNSCGCLQKEKASEHIKSLHYSGDAHHNWKGGVSSEWSRFSVSKKYKDFHSAVIARDGGKCQKCGSAANLRVHHIASFATNPSLRADINNAVCLCESCHLGFHKKYGKKYNTKEQLSEYLN